ncbi:MAG: MFS transporter [Bacteroidales bacterium]|nr:MFS transporter [Bacteroidales bacterium]
MNDFLSKNNFLTLKDLHPTTQKLILSRTFRSIGQGALVVDMTLYLDALGWKAFHIGWVLSVAGLFGALLSLGIGVTSDRLKRKPFLIVYESIIFLCSLAALLTAHVLILTLVIIIAGFGQGAGGAAGPFSPAEQAWLAEQVAPAKRGRVYSLNAAFGFFGMGIGALLAMIPAILHVLATGSKLSAPVDAAAYRPLFIVVMMATLANLWLITRAKEQYNGAKEVRVLKKDAVEMKIRRQENKMLTGLAILNSFNGLAIGLTSPLISYWFLLKFDKGPAAIAPMMAATFFITGISSVYTGRISEKIGIVKSVVQMRLVGLFLMILLPLAPFYWLASLIYILRSAFNRGTAGNRQALTIGLVREKRRGFATSLNSVSMQVTRSAGPGIAGLLFSAGMLEFPFFASAFLQGIYLVLYGRFFRNQNMPGQETKEVPKVN